MPTPANARDRSHARIYCHWRELPAWRCLSPAARALLLEIMMDYRPRPGNNGYLRWTVRRAASAVNVGKATAATALEELETCGWITCERIGGFGRSNAGSEFALTMFLNNRSGHLATFAFEHWEPAPSVIRARRSRVRPGGQDCPARGTHLSGKGDTRPKLRRPVLLSDALRKSRIGNDITGKGRKRSISITTIGDTAIDTTIEQPLNETDT